MNSINDGPTLTLYKQADSPSEGQKKKTISLTDMEMHGESAGRNRLLRILSLHQCRGTEQNA
jgi:hypothetical protein